MYRLELRQHFTDCPPEWRQFLKYLMKKYDPWTEVEPSNAIEIINQELEAFGAKKIGITVFFDDKSYYTAFMISYGKKFNPVA